MVISNRYRVLFFKFLLQVAFLVGYLHKTKHVVGVLQTEQVIKLNRNKFHCLFYLTTREMQALIAIAIRRDSTEVEQALCNS